MATATSCKRIERNAVTVRALQGASSAARTAVMRSAKRDLIMALVDCAKLIIKSPRYLDGAQLRALGRRAKEIAELIRPKATLEQRRRVLQDGGLLGALLGPLVKGILPNLLGGLLGRR